VVMAKQSEVGRAAVEGLGIAVRFEDWQSLLPRSGNCRVLGMVASFEGLRYYQGQKAQVPAAFAPSSKTIPHGRRLGPREGGRPRNPFTET